jgi:hypothetical protein
MCLEYPFIFSLFQFYLYKHIKLNDYICHKSHTHTPLHYRHPMPMDLTYHLNPLYAWAIFMVCNVIQPLISISIHSLDYRAALIFMNMVGLYLFLQHVRIDFTLRLTMNQ